jgi:hypothetical protein
LPSGVTGGSGLTALGTMSSSIDLNGNELILDADADTSIRADTDDRVDFKLGNTTTFQLGTAGLSGKFDNVTADEIYGGHYYKSGNAKTYVDRIFNKVGTTWTTIFVWTFTSGSWGGFWCEVDHSAQSNGANHDVKSMYHINGHSATTASIVAQYHLATSSANVANTVYWSFTASPCTAVLQVKHSQSTEQSFTRVSVSSDNHQGSTFGLVWN